MNGSVLEWVLSSAGLIAAVVLLRGIFGKRISARLRYALWGVVLLRLLVPVQLFTAPVETPRVLSEVSATFPAFQGPGSDREEVPDGGKLAVQAIPGDGGSPADAPEPGKQPFDWRPALGWLWLAGSVITAAVFIVSNWTFSRRLRRVRAALEGTDCPLAVYTAAGLPSPCLFGFPRPAVYVTPEAAGDPSVLRHVLVHEATHFRHGDHIWSLLRCAALAVHWWDPLVWLAALLSRRDCELACDEGALQRLGDGERRAYGNTLLALVTAKPRPGDLLHCATTMTGDKRSLRERVGRVAGAQKRWLWAAVLTAALSVLVCACAFARTESPKDGSLTAEELDRLNTDWHGEGPATPTVYPPWEPELVIPLDDLEPYRAAKVRVERHRGDVAERLYFMHFDSDKGGGCDVEVYRSVDGNVYAAVVVSEDVRDCFLTIEPDSERGFPVSNFTGVFTNLFGCEGVIISYYGWLDERYYGECNDYYTFSEDGTPSLLLRAKGETAVLDLDGDGVDELTADGGDTSQLFFQRDGQLYQAEIKSLLEEAWPEAGYMGSGWWDRESRSLPLSAQVSVPGSADLTATAFRQLFFDGENLRLYKDESVYTDHLASGLEALPAEVVAEARRFVQETFEAQAAEGYGADGSGSYDEENFGPGNVVWDDWRITGLSGPYYETAGEVRVEIWNVSYELHTTTPERVILAGGSYLGEDGWCMIGYPGCDYLYFQVYGDGSRDYLFSMMENDCAPGTELFREDLLRELAERGIDIAPEEDATGRP